MALSKSPIVCEQNDGCHIDPWNMIKELSLKQMHEHTQQRDEKRERSHIAKFG